MELQLVCNKVIPLDSELILLFLYILIPFILPLTIYTISIIFGSIVYSKGVSELRVRQSSSQSTHPNMLCNMRTTKKIPTARSVTDSEATFSPVVASNIQASGLVVLSTVYSLSTWSKLKVFGKSIFGGKITTAQEMLQLGREETIQRLREEAIRQGWTQVINVRIETLCLDKKNNRPSAFVEFCVYGTGIRY
jgi:uncharacterized protein YbjQ (UPF0145 family)